MATTKSEKVSWRSTYVTVSSGIFSSSPGNKHGAWTAYQTNSVSYGDNIKDWRKRIENKQNATTSLDGVRYTFPRGVFTYYLKVGTLGTVLYVGKVQGHIFPSSVDTTVELQATSMAKQKFASKARQRLHQWQGGVFAGELRQTAKLLASPTRSLFRETHSLLDSLLFLKKKQLRGRNVSQLSKKSAASLRNAIADTWLEWSFGVKPTISDINDAAQAFNELRLGTRKGDSIRIVGKGLAERQLSINTNAGVSLPPEVPNYTQCTEEVIARCETTIRAVYADFNPSGDMPVARTFGLDLSSILPTAWELVPWSFLVDYFTDVGNAIDAWSVRLIDFAWSNTTVRNRSTRYVYGGKIGPHAGISGSTFYCPSRYIASGSIYQVKRSVGLPTMEVYVPALKIPGYPDTKWLNMAALLNGITSLKRK